MFDTTLSGATWLHRRRHALALRKGCKFREIFTGFDVYVGDLRCYNICPADLEFSEAPDVTDFSYESRKVANVLVVDKSKTCVPVGIRL